MSNIINEREGFPLKRWVITGEEVRVFGKGLGVVRYENTFDSNQDNRFNYFLRTIHIPEKR